MLMFVLVSVLGGVLVAGLFVPTTGLVTETAKSVALAMNNIPEELEVGPPSEGSKVLMADGQVLTQFFDQNRKNVTLDNIAPIMRQAQVGIEDQRFYQHGALDLRGTLRALVRSSSGSAQGGSTLTQQYVKLALLYDAQSRNDTAGVEAANSRTVNRKILEMRYAIALEKKLTKDQILERYLNIAYFGDGAYGVEAAANHYFGVSAKDLSLPQAAMLAGIVRNPVTTNPVVNVAAATERMRNVLDRLVEINVIKQADADAAKQFKFDKTKVVPNPSRSCTASKYPHLCDYVYRVLKTLPSLGANPTDRVTTLNRAGLTIQTEIDPRFQDAAQESVSGFVAPTDPVNAVMNIVQPGTGLIKAMAQSKPEIGNGPGQTFYNYSASTSLGGAGGIEGGSTFKAFTLTAAMLLNAQDPTQFDPINLRIFSDYNHTFTLADDWKGCAGPVHVNWSPTTAESGNWNMYDGATESSNTFFTQLEQRVGVCNVVKAAELLGLKRADDANLETGLLPNGKSLDNLGSRADGMSPTFTLGNVPATPLSLVTAYATLAARGMRCDPIILKSITDAKSRTYAVPSANCQQVIPQGVADRVNDILHGPFSWWGTAEKAMIDGYLISGKTGTQKNATTILTNGYTPDLAGSALITVDSKHPEAKALKAATGNYQVEGLTIHGTNVKTGYTLQGKSGTEAGGQIWKPAMQAALALTPAHTQFVRPANSPYTGAQTNQDISDMQKNGQLTLGGSPSPQTSESTPNAADPGAAPVPNVGKNPAQQAPASTPASTPPSTPAGKSSKSPSAKSTP